MKLELKGWVTSGLIEMISNLVIHNAIIHGVLRTYGHLDLNQRFEGKVVPDRISQS